jgi:hypothetical protein
MDFCPNKAHASAIDLSRAMLPAGRLPLIVRFSAGQTPAARA